MARYDLSAPVPKRPRRPQPTAAAAPAPEPVKQSWRQLAADLDPRRLLAGLAGLLLAAGLVGGLAAWHCRRHIAIDGQIVAEGRKADLTRTTFLITTEDGTDVKPERGPSHRLADGKFHLELTYYAWKAPQTLSMRVRLRRHKTRRLAGLVIRDGKIDAGTIQLWRGRRGHHSDKV